MDESVPVNSSELLLSVSHTFRNEVCHSSREVSDADNQNLLSNDNLVTDAVTSAEQTTGATDAMDSPTPGLQAGCTAAVATTEAHPGMLEEVLFVLQTGSATAEADNAPSGMLEGIESPGQQTSSSAAEANEFHPGTLADVNSPEERGSAAAEVEEAQVGLPATAGDPSATINDSRHSNMEDQPCVNGDESLQQSEEKMLDLNSSQPEPGMNQVKQKFGAFRQLDHPASVVIDLRSPPLVQVCLLHGTDDVGAGGSSSMVAHHRPQTARRGRRLYAGMMDRSTSALTSHTKQALTSSRHSDKDAAVPFDHLLADSSGKNCSKDDSSTAELSTIIRLKVVASPANITRSEQSKFSPLTDNNMSDSHVRPPDRRSGGHDSESSDSETMRVRSVNRTYSRNSSTPAARKHSQQITSPKSADYHYSKKSSEVLSQHAQGFKSMSKKPKKSGKQRMRIGPAWYSRRSLSTPPPEIWNCARTSKTLKTMKRPNYISGVRRLPIVSAPPIVKQVLEVPVREEAEIESVGREELRLWRLNDEDVTELQSQLHQEAEHRRSEHIMPLVMQMTDAQIEHAYEHVAESMKTYEIVEADSDEDMEEDDEEVEAEVAEDYENSDYFKSSGWTVGDEVGVELDETEYSRLRPKRHAVDYGPSAFAPILIMEGRRVFSQRPKSSREPRVKAVDTADGISLQQQSRGRKSRRRRRKRSKVSEEAPTPVEKSTGDMDDATGRFVI